MAGEDRTDDQGVATEVVRTLLLATPFVGPRDGICFEGLGSTTEGGGAAAAAGAEAGAVGWPFGSSVALAVVAGALDTAVDVDGHTFTVEDCDDDDTADDDDDDGLETYDRDDVDDEVEEDGGGAVKDEGCVVKEPVKDADCSTTFEQPLV